MYIYVSARYIICQAFLKLKKIIQQYLQAKQP